MLSVPGGKAATSMYPRGLAIYGLIFGGLRAWLADQKGRDQAAWFFGGLLLGFMA
jgi:hypothetical protein